MAARAPASRAGTAAIRQACREDNKAAPNRYRYRIKSRCRFAVVTSKRRSVSDKNRDTPTVAAVPNHPAEVRRSAPQASERILQARRIITTLNDRSTMGRRHTVRFRRR